MTSSPENYLPIKAALTQSEPEVSLNLSSTTAFLPQTPLSLPTLYDEASRAAYQALLSNWCLGHWSANANGKLYLISESLADWTGISVANDAPRAPEQLSKEWKQARHPDDTAAETAWENAVATGTPYQAVFRMRRQEGEWQLVREIAVPVHDADGNVREWVGALSIVTDTDESAWRAQESEQRFRALCEASSGGMLLLQPDGRVIEASASLKALSGGDVSLENWLAHVFIDDRARVESVVRECFQTGQQYEVTYRLFTASGELRHYITRSVPLKNSDGSIREWVATTTDITCDTLADESARRSEDRYRTLTEATSDGIIAFTPNGVLSEVSPATAFCLGKEAQTLIGAPMRAYLALIHRRDRRTALAALVSASQTRQLVQTEVRVRCYERCPDASGNRNDLRATWRRWRIRAVPLRSSQKTEQDPPAWIAAVSDITRQTDAVEALRQSEDRFRSLIEASVDGVWRAGTEGNLLDISEGWRRHTGLAPKDVEGDNWVNTVHPDDRAPMMQTWRQAVETGNPYFFQYRVQSRDGQGQERILYRHSRGVPVREVDGSIREWVGTLTDITQEVEAQEEIRRSEEEFRSLVEASAGEVWRADAVGLLLSATPGMLSFLGITNERISQEMTRTRTDHATALLTILQQVSIKEHVHPDDREQWSLLREEAVQKREPYNHLARVHRASDPPNQYRWLRSHGVPLCAASGAIRAWVGTFTDVTEQVEAERRIAESEERSRHLLEAFTDGIFLANPDSTVTQISAGLAHMVGLPPDAPVEAFRQLWTDAIHPEDRDKVVADAMRQMREGRLRDARYRVLLKGRERRVRVQATALTDANGNVREWVGAISDITDVEQAQEALRHSEERFRSLVQATFGGVWQAGPQGNLVALSGDALRFVGIDEADIEREQQTGTSREGALRNLLQGVRIRDRVHPDDKARLDDATDTALGVEQRQAHIARLHRAGDPPGSWRHVRTLAVPLRENNGNVREWIGTFTDVTEQIEAEQKLSQSEHRLSLLVNILGNGVWRANKDGDLIDVAPGLAARMGVRVPDLLGQGWLVVLHPDDVSNVTQVWEQAIQNRSVLNVRYRVRMPDASFRYMRSMAVPLLDDEGDVQEWVGTLTDIHDQHEAEARLKESEERLREAQRLTRSGSWYYNIVADDLSWSDQMFALLEQEQAYGALTLAEMLAQFDAGEQERLDRLLRWTVQHGTTFAQDFSAHTMRGNARWFQVIVQAERKSNGDIVALFGTVLDITERKELEEESRRAQQFARRVALAVPDMLYVYDLQEGRTVYANHEVGALLGYTPEEIRDITRAPGAVIEGTEAPLSTSMTVASAGSLAGQQALNTALPSGVSGLETLIHPEDAGRLVSSRDRLHRVRDGQLVETVFRQRHRDGKWRWLHTREMIFSRETSGNPREIMGLAQDITERKTAQDDLRESEEKFRSLIGLLSDWVWESDCNGNYTYVSPQVTTCLGYLPKEMTGLSPFDFMHEEDRERTRVLSGGIVRTRASFTSLMMRFLALSGEAVYLEVSGVPLYDTDGEWIGYRGVSRDVTRRRQAEEALRNREERLTRLIESSPDSIATLDLDGGLLTLNDGGLRLMNLRSLREVKNSDWLARLGARDGKGQFAVATFIEPSGIASSIDPLAVVRAGKTTRWVSSSVPKRPANVHSENSAPQWWDVVLAPLLGSDGKPEHILCIARDISRQKALEAQKDELLARAVEQAERDPLTGVYDHRAFHQRLVDEGERARREGRSLSVALVDVDNFKFFNDAFGHLEGDAVLRHVADVLQASVRNNDVVGRLGGDEFAVLMPGVGRMEGYHVLGERVQANPAAGFWKPAAYDAPIPLRMSFGVAAFPDEAQTPLQALHLADERLYRSKRDGHDGILESLRQELGETLVGFPMLDSLVTAVDGKDRYTRRHSEDVLVYAVMIAQKLGVSPEELTTLRVAALLHDVGKIGVSSRILRLPTKLTSSEYEAIKQHAALGAGLVESLLREGASSNTSIDLTQLVDAVRYHHEAWNGQGYPDGLSGENIPFMARILAVADSYSALTTDRPYRKGRTQEDALRVLREGAGRQWDARCVHAFLQVQRPQ